MARTTLSAKLREWLAQHAPAQVEPHHVGQILVDLAPIKEPSLRRLLRQSQYPLSPLVEGVRQDSLDNLQRTLSALAGEYVRNPVETRRLVLQARQHCEWALRRQPGDPQKEETMLWLRTWLENPAIFPTWSRLRRENSP